MDLDNLLNSEEIAKKTDFKHGTIHLTNKHLIWKTKTKEIPDSIIPLSEIQKVMQSSKPGLGFGLLVVYGEDSTHRIFLPFINTGFPPTPNFNEIQEWITNFQKDSPPPKRIEFTNIVYAGGHSAHPEKHNGKLILTPTHLIFQELSLSLLAENSLGKFRLEIPIKLITNISVQSIEQISRLTSVLAGPLWSMGFPARHKFLLVEYLDDVKLKHAPIFDFPGDFGDKKKGQIMQKLHSKMRDLRSQQTEKRPEVDEPLKILKIRFAKGEINKDEYLEMKKILEQD